LQFLQPQNREYGGARRIRARSERRALPLARPDGRLTVFVIEIERDGAWALELGDYFMRADGVGGAIATASGRQTRDEVPRRVSSWPDPCVIWPVEALTEKAAGVFCPHTEE
jgi:hypothetical protein